MPVSTQNSNFKQNSSLSTQFKQTFNSSVKEVSSSVSGTLKSAATSVSDTVDNVSNFAKNLGKQGMSAVSSVREALNQLSGLGSYSKFKDNFVPPTRLTTASPEESLLESSRYLGGLTFPEILGDYYITFTFKAYVRKVALEEPKQLPVVTINLPIPASLQEQFNMQYADKQLGVAGIIEDLLPNTAKTFTTTEAEALGKEIAETVISKQGAYYGARTFVNLSDSAGSAFDKATGSILNPFQALLFQGVNLRSHNFSYRFSPNSARENEVLKKIIYEFKRRMHPLNRGLLYEFPDVVDIAFNKKNGEPYFFKTCFLESMSLNYAPSGTPAFFATTSNPVEVEMNLSFKEVGPLTREDFKPPTQTTYLGPN